jgi:hypothetical protein
MRLTFVEPTRDLGIAPGSAVVAMLADDFDHLVIYYEGNLYGAENLRTWEQRLECAAGRLVAKYPTVARMTVENTAVRPLGEYDTVTKTVTWYDPVERARHQHREGEPE